mgnify:CR=1 FL=1
MLVPANYNSNEQIVLSGSKKSIEDTLKRCQKIGLRKVVPLKTSGAFHSPLMKSARNSLSKVIKSVDFKDAKIPIYQNVSANPVTESFTIRENIINQLENPVLWSETILNMKKSNFSYFIEIGPGKVLKGLNQRIYPESTTINCDKMENLDACEVL